MKINPDRYDTQVERVAAESASELSALIGSFNFTHGFSLSESKKTMRASRLSADAKIKFPEKLKGYTFFSRN